MSETIKPMGKKSMYSINNEYLVLQQKLMENDGELTDAEYRALDALHEDGDAKVIGYYHVIRNLDLEKAVVKGELDYMMAEVDRLKSVAKSIDKNQERMLETLDEYFALVKAIDPAIQRTAFKDGSVEFKYRQSTKNLIDENGLYPSQFMTPQPPALNSSKLISWAKKKDTEYAAKVTERELAIERGQVFSDEEVVINENIYVDFMTVYTLSPTRPKPKKK